MGVSWTTPRVAVPATARQGRVVRGFKWLTSMGSNPHTRVGEGRTLPPRPSLPANTHTRYWR